MYVKETLNDGLRRSYEITVPGAKLESMVQEKLSEATAGFSQKGFRKGRVPTHILKKKIGTQTYNDAMLKSINEAVSDLLRKNGDRPAFKPNLQFKNDSWKEGDDVLAEVYYENIPEIPAIDFKSIQIKRLAFEIPEDFIDHFINEKKEEKSENKEQNVISNLDDSDGASSAVNEHSHESEVVSNQNDISEQLIKTPLSEQKSEEASDDAHELGLTLTDQDNPSMMDIGAQGQDLDADFHAGSEKNVRKQIGLALESKLRSIIYRNERQKIIDGLLDQCSFDIPPTVLKNESLVIAKQRVEDKKQSDSRDNNVTPHENDIQIASRRVKLGYLFHALAARSRIEVLPAEIDQFIANIAGLSNMSFNQASKEIKQNEQTMTQINNEILERKVLNYVSQSVTIVEIAAKEEEIFELLFPTPK
ncbi:MAG: trigger factor [Aestuariivita sp.]|nr:trigger factor [Aestuariivita sp.]